jgi:7-cyano-7-deazaguanine synthase in queuosine biosynthesis
MRINCRTSVSSAPTSADALNVVLYGQAPTADIGSAGHALKLQIAKEKLSAPQAAWDFLSLALSVVVADLAGHRDESPDGWTRDFFLSVAVADPIVWNAQRENIERTLAFLTTDRWHLEFVGGGFTPTTPAEVVRPQEDCVVLLSGGLDSLIGAIDLVASGRRPFAVSQTVRGDAENQERFAQTIGGGLRHLQINHNADLPNPENPASQRGRSMVFLAYGVLAAASLRSYDEGNAATMFICENGFIAVNPPLTGARLGSLSTRTAHPAFLRGIQELLNGIGLRVSIENPYRHRTKGEMLRACADQNLIRALAATSTSCGRFKVFGYRHCGRCMPCQIRRAAFLAWGVADTTSYVYAPLGRADDDHAGFDDVRSAAMAIAEVSRDGLDRWLGNALTGAPSAERPALKGVVTRGLDELVALHRANGVR